MHSHWLPLSIVTLAAAVALHAVQPAIADVPPEPEPPTPTAEEPLAPECKPIRLGTPKEFEKAMGELHASGRTQMTVIGTGLVCAWR